MVTLFLPLALACYAISSAGFIADRALGRMKWTGWAALFLATGAIFHALDMVARGIQAGNFPVANFAESLSFLAWLTALIGLVLIVRSRMAIVGAFVGPIVTIASLVASLMMRTTHLRLPESLRSVWLPIHVTLALLGCSMFVLATAVSLIYLIFESRLKAKRAMRPANSDVPSLEKLDRINYRLLGWGFLMLSLAIVSGAIWADATWGHFWSWEPVESWSLVIWILYAGLLESRLTVGWRGRRAAALTIVLFTVLVGSFLGVSLTHAGKHGGSFG
jgi:cytochrome c-type biogenesis protein CcsB